MKAEDWLPGARAYWRFTPRGGYGFTRVIPVEVIRSTRRKVTVRATTTTGEKREVSVEPRNLSRFADSAP